MENLAANSEPQVPPNEQKTLINSNFPSVYSVSMGEITESDFLASLMTS